jgi:predicted Fe-Mo cluster-binding NifX family protein
MYKGVLGTNPSRSISQIGYQSPASRAARRAVEERENMVAISAAGATAIAGLAGAGASIYGAHSAGRTQDRALRQAQSNLERGREERQAAWKAWQESQAPVFQLRQDALMSMTGRYRGPKGGTWTPPTTPPMSNREQLSRSWAQRYTPPGTTMESMTDVGRGRLPPSMQVQTDWGQGNRGRFRRDGPMPVPGSGMNGRMGQLYSA